MKPYIVAQSLQQLYLVIALCGAHLPEQGLFRPTAGQDGPCILKCGHDFSGCACLEPTASTRQSTHLAPQIRKLGRLNAESPIWKPKTPKHQRLNPATHIQVLAAYPRSSSAGSRMTTKSVCRTRFVRLILQPAIFAQSPTCSRYTRITAPLLISWPAQSTSTMKSARPLQYAWRQFMFLLRLDLWVKIRIEGAVQPKI